jgi:hypothetical protein
MRASATCLLHLHPAERRCLPGFEHPGGAHRLCIPAYRQPDSPASGPRRPGDAYLGYLPDNCLLFFQRRGRHAAGIGARPGVLPIQEAIRRLSRSRAARRYCAAPTNNSR